jgi:CheY-specific phosphatase CheX
MIEREDPIKTAVTTAVCATMEGMAFEQMESIEGAPDQLESEDKNLWVSLEIVNPCRGQVIIELPWVYADLVARAMYGEIDGDIPEEVIQDTLAELSNTLAGRFMLELLGPDLDYGLGFPITGKGFCPSIEDRIQSLHFAGSGHNLRVDVVGNDFKEFSEKLTKTSEVMT